MTKENNNQSGSFTGLNIAALEKDLGMILPGNGESSGENNEPDEDKKETKTNLDLGFFSQKMKIPETKEEIEAANGDGKKKDDESGEVEEDLKKQGKGGEDVIIKEDSPLYLHAATLHEEGILPTLDLESLKGKPFKEGMQLLKDAQKKFFDEGRNAYQNSLTDRQKEFLEMIELGIPQEQVEHQFTLEDVYSKVTDQVLSDDVELQKQIITQDLKLKGLSDTQVQRSLKASEENETLFEDSKESRGNINGYINKQKQDQINTAKQEQVLADQRELDLQKEIKTTIDKIDEILPGIKVSANEKTKLNELMTKPVEERVIAGKKVPVNLINKVRSENRVLFDLKLNYYIELGLFNEGNKTDLAKIIKKVTSNNADKLAKRLLEEPNGPDGKGVTFEKNNEQNKNTKIIFPQFK